MLVGEVLTRSSVGQSPSEVISDNDGEGAVEAAGEVAVEVEVAGEVTVKGEVAGDLEVQVQVTGDVYVESADAWPTLWAPSRTRHSPRPGGQWPRPLAGMDGPGRERSRRAFAFHADSSDAPQKSHGSTSWLHSFSICPVARGTAPCPERQPNAGNPCFDPPPPVDAWRTITRQSKPHFSAQICERAV